MVIGNWKLETGNWKPETGNWKPETGNWKPEVGRMKKVYFNNQIFGIILGIGLTGISGPVASKVVNSSYFSPGKFAYCLSRKINQYHTSKSFVSRFKKVETYRKKLSFFPVDKCLNKETNDHQSYQISFRGSYKCLFLKKLIEGAELSSLPQISFLEKKIEAAPSLDDSQIINLHSETKNEVTEVTVQRNLMTSLIDIYELNTHNYGDNLVETLNLEMIVKHQDLMNWEDYRFGFEKTRDLEVILTSMRQTVFNRSDKLVQWMLKQENYSIHHYQLFLKATEVFKDPIDALGVIGTLFQAEVETFCGNDRNQQCLLGNKMRPLIPGKNKDLAGRNYHFWGYLNLGLTDHYYGPKVFSYLFEKLLDSDPDEYFVDKLGLQVGTKTNVYSRHYNPILQGHLQKLYPNCSFK
jgi:hypothetical protein